MSVLCRVPPPFSCLFGVFHVVAHVQVWHLDVEPSVPFPFPFPFPLPFPFDSIRTITASFAQAERRDPVGVGTRTRAFRTGSQEARDAKMKIAK